MPELKLPNHDQNIAHIQTQYALLFKSTEKAWELALTVLPEGVPLDGGKPFYFHWCMAAVYAKQMRLFAANHLLCSRGLGIESLMICRSLYETMVNLKAMVHDKDPNEYARLWLIWDLANRVEMAKAIIDHYPESQKALNDMYSQLSVDRARFNSEEWADFLRNGPSGVGPKTLAEKVGLKIAHQSFYKLASSSVHGFDIVSYAIPIADHKITSSLAPTLDWVDSNLAMSVGTLWGTLVDLNDVLQLGKDETLKALQKIVDTLHKEKVSMNT